MGCSCTKGEACGSNKNGIGLECRMNEICR